MGSATAAAAAIGLRRFYKPGGIPLVPSGGVGGHGRMPSSRSCRGALLFLSFSSQSIMDITTVAIPTLALSLSASPLEIGLMATSRGIVYALLPFLIGYFSDRADRRLMLASSMSIYALVAILFYLSRSPAELIALRLFEGLAMSIFWPTIEPLFIEARDSRISESLREFNLSWGLGQIVGPLVGGGLITMLGVRSPFLLVSAVAAANIALIASRLPAGGAAGGEAPVRPEKGDGLSISLVSTNILLGAILYIFFAFFPAFGISAGFSALEVGAMLFLFGIARLAFFYKAPSMRMGLEPRVGLASLGLILIYLGDRATIYPGIIMTSAAASLVYAYTIERMLRVEEGFRGRRAGIFEGSLGMGFASGPLLAGLFAGPSLSNAFIVASSLGPIFIIALRARRALVGRA